MSTGCVTTSAPQQGPFIVVLLGGPGSGKSTQAKNLCQRYHFEYFNAGEYLRKLRETDKELDNNFNRKIGAARLEPALQQKIEFVAKENQCGLVIDYAKSPAGCKQIATWCSAHGLQVGLTILLEVDDTLHLIQRCVKRTGRDGDSTILGAARRVVAYTEHQRYIEHHSNVQNFKVVDGSLPAQRVTDIIGEYIKQLCPTLTVHTPTIEGESPSEAVDLSELNEMPQYLTFAGFNQSQHVIQRLQKLVCTFPGKKPNMFPGVMVFSMDEHNVRTVCTPQRNFKVSKKLDGTRYLLVYTEKICYLVSRTLLVYTVQTHPPLCELLGESEQDNTLILDCELVLLNSNVGTPLTPQTSTTSAEQPANRPDQKGPAALFVFDVLYGGGKNLMKKDLEERLSFAPKLSSEDSLLTLPQNEEGRVLVVLKKFHDITAIPKLLDEYDRSTTTVGLYNTDGLIFTPPGEYNSQELFKWKPPERATVDFELRYCGQHTNATDIVPTQFELRVTTDRGTQKFCDLHMDIQSDQFNTPEKIFQLHNAIIECKPTDFKFRKDRDHKWVIERVRYDKNTPNNIRTAHGAITWITINRLRQIYEQAQQQPPSTDGGTSNHTHANGNGRHGGGGGRGGRGGGGGRGGRGGGGHGGGPSGYGYGGYDGSCGNGYSHRYGGYAGHGGYDGDGHGGYGGSYGVGGPGRYGGGPSGGYGGGGYHAESYQQPPPHNTGQQGRGRGRTFNPDGNRAGGGGRGSDSYKQNNPQQGQHRRGRGNYSNNNCYNAYEYKARGGGSTHSSSGSYAQSYQPQT